MWTRCVKRELLKAFMFVSERLCYTEDVLFNIALSKYIKTIEYIPEPLYNYYVTKGSLTNTYRKNMWDMLMYRQNWIRDYSEKNRLGNKAAERFLKSNWSAIQMACNNACKNQFDGDKEIRDIYEFANATGMFKNIGLYFKYMSVTEKIRFILLKIKAFKLYYKLFNHIS